MKHLFTKLSVMACALLAAAAITACDSSDSDGMELQFEEMYVEFTYNVSDDLLKVADITLNYTDPADGGSQQSLTITADNKSLIFYVKRFPVTYTVSAAATLKSGIVLDQAPYDLTREITTQFRAYYNDGKVHWSQGPDTDRYAVSVDVEEGNPDAVTEGINTYLGDMAQTYTYTITQQNDGSFVVQTL